MTAHRKHEEPIVITKAWGLILWLCNHKVALDDQPQPSASLSQSSSLIHFVLSTSNPIRTAKWQQLIKSLQEELSLLAELAVEASR